MKAFFILLLLTNIVFAVLQWLFPYEQVFSRPTPTVAAEQLQLLAELESKTETPIENEFTDTRTVQARQPAIPKKLCYTLGPFKDESNAQEVIVSFARHDLQMTSRPSLEKEYLGMMVYIDGHISRTAAMKTADALAERGIRDYMLVNEEGKENALSLGVFGLKKNADRRMQRISKLGYPVKSEPRYRNRTIYWLDYSKQENQALADLVDRLKKELGISRISHACS